MAHQNQFCKFLCRYFNRHVILLMTPPQKRNATPPNESAPVYEHIIFHLSLLKAKKMAFRCTDKE